MPAVLLTTLLFFGFLLLVNQIVKILTGNSLLTIQRDFFIWAGAASAVLCWILAYLNVFVAIWPTQSENMVMQGLLYTPLFALLVPAVLITRSLLGTFGGFLKFLSNGIAIPSPRTEALISVLLPVALAGLAGGAAWPEKLFWLLWLAPLLLLTVLQLLWSEGTIFSSLKSGDWGRVICAALAGIIVGNFALITYQYNGGTVNINLPGILKHFGLATFGLLCLQIGDVIAENWRGKQRHEVFPKKKFPIPIIVKKN